MTNSEDLITKDAALKLSLVLSVGQLGLWEWNLKTNKLNWDARMFEIYGVQADQFLGAYEVWSSSLHPEDRAMAEASIALASENKKDFKYEFRIIRPDKSIRFIQASGRTCQVADGDPFMIGVSLDVTELRQTEEKFRSVIESVPNAIIAVDAKGVITLTNKHAENMFGYTREELLGQTIEILLPKKLRANHPGHRNTFFSKPSTRAMGAGRDLFGEKKDGSEFPIEIGLNPMVTSEGTFVLASIIDISERKQIESTIKSKAFELEKTNRELDEFAYIISHDLKAPLRAIGSVTDWLKEDYDAVLDEAGKKHLVTLKNRVERMGNLIDGVLRYARIGKENLESELVSFSSISKSCIEALEISPNIKVIISPNLPDIYGAKILFEQVFQNLVSNAVKFMDKPVGIIEINSIEADGFWHFSVKDNGPGIEKEHFDRIFKIFQTLNPRSKIESTGIGLTIVKKIVTLYGGRVWIESQLGSGTTVHFTLSK